jgi:hypothetical protein
MKTLPFTPPEKLETKARRSVSYGQRRFSTREDYAALFSERHPGDDPWNDPSFSAAVMRDWHEQAQTGCLFARRLAMVADEAAWPSVVFTDPIGESLASEIRERVTPALELGIATPGCEIVSLLFTRIVDSGDLRPLCEALTQGSRITMATLQAPRGIVIVALRLDIGGDDTLAWIMAFGPFLSWPPTRRGPLLEFAIRVKPKPTNLFHELNQDPSAAHLADSDPHLSEDQMAKVFDRTKMATRDVLGHNPGERTAAKATFSLPVTEWDGEGRRR